MHGVTTHGVSRCRFGMHSTLTDPNFVKNYFASSRLHFIGTWRDHVQRVVADAIAARAAQGAHAKQRVAQHQRRQRRQQNGAGTGMGTGACGDADTAPASDALVPTPGFSSATLASSSTPDSPRRGQHDDDDDDGSGGDEAWGRDEAFAALNGNSTSAASENRVLVHIDMDCFFASVSLLNRPDLKDQPVAVAHSGGCRASLCLRACVYVCVYVCMCVCVCVFIVQNVDVPSLPLSLSLFHFH